MAVLLTACQSVNELVATPTPTPGIPEEHMPAPASVRIEGDPIVATRAITVDLQGDGFAREGRIESGERIHIEFYLGSGQVRLSIEDGCVLPLALAPNTETDVVLTLGEGRGCGLRQTGQHGGEFVHDWVMGVVTGQVPPGVGGGTITMDVRSLDDPPNPVPEPDEVDESGFLYMENVPTGQYEVRLLVDGEPVSVVEVKVDDRGMGGHVEFEVPSG